MGLTDLFNQWIVERGSAVVQEKHLSLFRDQLALADKRISELESENTVLKSQFSNSETKSEHLTKENNELKQKIKEYENPAQSNLLDEKKESILIFLSRHEPDAIIQTANIAENMRLSLQVALFHLAELEKRAMVRAHYPPLAMTPQVAPYGWYLTQDGRSYLIEHNYLW